MSISTISDSTLFSIFHFLFPKDLAFSHSTCNKWKTIIDGNSTLKIKSLGVTFFSSEDWERFFGKVDKVPPLPKQLSSYLSKNVFLEKTQVRVSHILILIPHKLNGNDVSLNLFKKVLKKSKGSKSLGYEHFYPRNHGDIVIPKPYWALVTMKCIPKSWGQSFNPHFSQASLESLEHLIFRIFQVTLLEMFTNIPFKSYSKSRKTVCSIFQQSL